MFSALSSEQFDAIVRDDCAALGERFQAVVMQRYYIEALAIQTSDGRCCVTVALNEFDDADCIYNLCDFSERYHFKEAVIHWFNDDDATVTDTALLMQMVAHMIDKCSVDLSA